jgi:hypothetical protein
MTRHDKLVSLLTHPIIVEIMKRHGFSDRQCKLSLEKTVVGSVLFNDLLQAIEDGIAKVIKLVKLGDKAEDITLGQALYLEKPRYTIQALKRFLEYNIEEQEKKKIKFLRHGNLVGQNCCEARIEFARGLIWAIGEEDVKDN